MPKFIDFQEMPSPAGRKTKIFAVINTLAQIPLGTVRFHGAWRKYVFMPENNMIFDSVCLREIAEFTDMATKRWREGL